jgi:endonuclease-3 related protein
MSSNLQEVYQKLLDHFGSQHGWSGQSPWEVLVGAVLTQNTARKNVVLAIDNLRRADVLDPHRLHDMATEELAELIRPAGYHRQKARRLKNLIALLVTRYEGSLERMFSIGRHALRDELLAINGIGPETADSILLDAAQLPTFVVDACTARVLKRHGWIDPDADYHEIQDYFVYHLPEDVHTYSEFHALLVRLGNQYCRRLPKCDQCPLQELLPDGGPLDWSR